MPISTAGIARRDGRYFLALRHPGTSIGVRWEFPGGKAEEGETPQVALCREYQEEFGIQVEVGEQVFEGSFTNRSTKYRLLAFNIRFITEEISLTEHSEVRWIDADELAELPMAYSDSLIRDFLLHEKT